MFGRFFLELCNEWLKIKSDFFSLNGIHLMFALLISKFACFFGSSMKIALCAGCLGNAVDGRGVRSKCSVCASTQ